MLTLKNNMVLKSQSFDTIILQQIVIAPLVCNRLLYVKMVISIKLYSQLQLWTIKVQYIIIYTVLPPKFQASHTFTFQQIP